jgi:hypothetical protein
MLLVAFGRPLHLCTSAPRPSAHDQRSSTVGYDPEKTNANTSGNQPPKKDDAKIAKALGKTALGGKK